MVDRPEDFAPERIPSRLGMAERDRQRVLDAARRFRQRPTPSERLLWEGLRAGKLGVKFRRQHPIGPLVVDFCCPSVHLVVEVDGPIHDQQAERDAARQHLLEDRGYRVLRLRAADVEAHTAAALDRIAMIVHDSAHGIPSPSMGEGQG